MKLLALGLLASTLLATACGGGHAKVYVQGTYKPDKIVLGAGTPIMDIQWLSYGGPIAKARGMYAANECQPNCALGQVVLEPTSFSVSYVGPCTGRRSYRLISIPIRGVKDVALQDC
jgi:hypothetical protein